MSDDPKVSEGMLNLVTDFGADCVNYGCNQLRPMVGYPIIENVQHREKERALLSAIAAIEARAEKAEAERDKWKRVAVALEQLRRTQMPDPFELQRSIDNLSVAIADLYPAWDEAVE